MLEYEKPFLGIAIEQPFFARIDLCYPIKLSFPPPLRTWGRLSEFSLATPYAIFYRTMLDYRNAQELLRHWSFGLCLVDDMHFLALVALFCKQYQRVPKATDGGIREHLKAVDRRRRRLGVPSNTHATLIFKRQVTWQGWAPTPSTRETRRRKVSYLRKLSDRQTHRVRDTPPSAGHPVPGMKSSLLHLVRLLIAGFLCTLIVYIHFSSGYRCEKENHRHLPTGRQGSFFAGGKQSSS
ncbi:hypothetical protein CNYM01_12953 [Colletotrichum nymphaeae SA-01]|uniref:Uncharacterized protein n=1 Tax=Colletotrichum nymphaeae SA-01 TaxID=1460502 RepID=A0A135RUZ4_9PEZI|nr:hypothetical protein CNYM01_12953 [Colletotrichum nymphaeae SA-01]